MLHDLNPFLYWLCRSRQAEQLRVPVAHLWLLLPRFEAKTPCDVRSIGCCLMGWKVQSAKLSPPVIGPLRTDQQIIRGSKQRRDERGQKMKAG